MAPSYSRGLTRAVYSVAAVSSIFASSSLASSPSPPAASPAADVELICHTDNVADCYPKVFEATNEFQIVHDDQDLPPGLHVQLDVQTGQKQAKIYNPDEDENPALAGLPVNQEVIVVDRDPAQDDEPKIPANAPAYEPVGVVKPPKEKNEEFPQALATIKKSLASPQGADDNGTLQAALQVLEDLSHDVYYGLQIAEDAEAVQSLFCLLLRRDADPLKTAEVNSLASAVLSASVSNNAKALAAIESAWDSIAKKQCNSESRPISQELFHRFAPVSAPGNEEEGAEIEVMRYYLPVINGLLKSPKIRDEFLANNGMQSFLQILLRDNQKWERRQQKVAQIVSDTFLDEDFGATLGIWPTQAQADANVCVVGESPSLSDECWAYHLSQMVDAPEWSQHLLSLIKQEPIPGSYSETPAEHDEL